MKFRVTFRPYSPADKEICLAIFDVNCPPFFAPNERIDYEQFLDSNPSGYELCLHAGSVVGAYGLIGDGTIRRNLNWVLLSPKTQQLGVGSAIMNRVLNLARNAKLSIVDIAASHLSAPFFAKFGATVVNESKNGWGPGLHRIDMELKL